MFSTSASPAMAFKAQDVLLKYFLRSSVFERKDTVKYGLNYVQITRNNKSMVKRPRTLILMHGFGLGLGFFYDNYDALANNFDRIIAVDWPGMGSSSRDTMQMKKLSWMCSMPARLINKTSIETYSINVAKQVTNEFIDSLEDLRAEEGITDFVLAGHSLGGYLAGKYAVKYPQHVKGLVLISPVGIPNPPIKEMRVEPSQLDWRIRMLKSLWEMNFTPQSIVRIAGSKGPELVKSAIDKRFAKEWESKELKILSDYLYQITALPANGEYALNTLLEPIFTKSESGKARSGVYAKDPLEEQLSALRMPLLLIYGDTDWLYYPTAPQSIATWKKHGVDAEMKIISKAGHHLYIDNSKEFNDTVTDWAKQKSLV